MKLMTVEKIADLLDDVTSLSESAAEKWIHELISHKEKIPTTLKVIKALEKFDHCSECNFWRYDSHCEFCNNLAERDISVLCIVNDPLSVAAVENTGVYNGLYLVLKAQISAQRAEKTFKKLNILQIMNFVKERHFKEIIFATNFSIGGEWTARFIRQELEKKWKGIKYTRLACGIPTGAEINFVDIVSLKKAILHRDVFTEFTYFNN